MGRDGAVPCGYGTGAQSPQGAPAAGQRRCAWHHLRQALAQLRCPRAHVPGGASGRSGRLRLHGRKDAPAQRQLKQPHVRHLRRATLSARREPSSACDGSGGDRDRDGGGRRPPSRDWSSGQPPRTASAPPPPPGFHAPRAGDHGLLPARQWHFLIFCLYFQSGFSLQFQQLSAPPPFCRRCCAAGAPHGAPPPRRQRPPAPSPGDSARVRRAGATWRGAVGVAARRCRRRAGARLQRQRGGLCGCATLDYHHAPSSALDGGSVRRGSGRGKRRQAAGQEGRPHSLLGEAAPAPPPPREGVGTRQRKRSALDARGLGDQERDGGADATDATDASSSPPRSSPKPSPPPARSCAQCAVRQRQLAGGRAEGARSAASRSERVMSRTARMPWAMSLRAATSALA